MTGQIKDRIKELCKKNKISMNALEKELGLGSGYISKLDKSTPNARNIQKIANRFEVSVDYLMGYGNWEIRTQADIDAELTRLNIRLKMYMQQLAKLTDVQQNIVFSMIDEMSKKEGED